MNPLDALGKLFYNRQLTYGYAATRVRARKALLLQKSFYEDLLNQRTFDGMIGMLERTYYKKVLTGGVLQDYFTPGQGSRFIEMAAEIHYKDVVNKVRSFTPEDGLPVLNMLMRKWDILNLRTIISSRRMGKRWDDIYPYLVSAGELSISELKRIAESDPEKLYVRIRATPVGRQILSQSSKGLRGTELEQMFIKAVKNTEVLNQLQIILDASYYNYLEGSIVSSDRDIVWIKNIVSKEIDLRNIINVLRLKEHGVKEVSKIEPHLIKGGRARAGYIEELIKTGSYKDVVQLIRPLFKLEKEEYGSLAELETAMQQQLAKERVRIFYRNPVSIATIVGFLLIKEEEMNNLRKIVRGKDYHLSPEEIKPMLVYC
ncbi:MAG: V-type ATPase subunit [Candidatus Micrarchaeia archaeon]